MSTSNGNNTKEHHYHHGHHHPQRKIHHLSSKASDNTGWVESIGNLTDHDAATEFLASDQPTTPPAISNRTKPSSSPPNGTIEALDSLTIKDDSKQVSPEEEFSNRIEHCLEALSTEVNRVGELLAEIGTPQGYGPISMTPEQLETVLNKIRDHCDKEGVHVVVLRTRQLPSIAPPTSIANNNRPSESSVADVLLRRQPKFNGTGLALEIRVAIVGNVDSGKSTFVGCLTRSILDDGRGLARSKVFKHGHEEATGRTSSIGQHNLCLDVSGAVLNDSTYRVTTSADFVAKSAKVVTMVDLAGHEKYFKTTAYGLTGHLPDYACVIIGANAGVVGMCKEHLGVALALRVPVFFVVTKVDHVTPDHVAAHTLSTLQTILKKPGVKKKPFVVRTTDDVITCARHINSDSLAPIFLTSAVTGQGLDLVRMFFSLLPQRQNWFERVNDYAEFVIDETFGVPGVGTVIAGTVKRGVVTPNTNFLLGPDIADGTFKHVAIKSIHYKRLPVGRVAAGQTASLALKKVKRTQVRKGMALVDERLHPESSWEFDADIAILTHSTTIQPKYQAVIHCEIVRQAARVVAMDKERLRSGDRAVVRFRFLQRPEYLTPGARFVFREGKTKGVGIVVSTEASANAEKRSNEKQVSGHHKK